VYPSRIITYRVIVTERMKERERDWSDSSRLQSKDVDCICVCGENVCEEFLFCSTRLWNMSIDERSVNCKKTKLQKLYYYKHKHYTDTNSLTHSTFSTHEYLGMLIMTTMKREKDCPANNAAQVK
jgi:hypothetical protein